MTVSKDGGAQAAGAGTLTHMGGGAWDYAPTQAETNANHIAFQFTHASGVNQLVNVYTVSFDPHDTVRMGLTALPNAAAGANGGLPTIDASLRVSANVTAMAADVLTASALAADAGTEIGTAVWATATRRLTDGTNIVLAKGTGVTGFNDLDAVGVRGAVGLAAANLDTQLAAIDTKTTNLPTDPADQSLVIAATDAIMTRLGAPAGASVSADVAAVKSDTAAVKTKTDSLTFTLAGKLDVNVLVVNGITVRGSGTAVDPWGPV